MSVTYRKKLIEVALPLPEINDASAYDKMPGIGAHPKGIHQWWARLPLPTARAILFASVVDDPSEHPERWRTEAEQDAERDRLFGLLRQLLGKKLHDHPEVYQQVRREMLAHCDGTLPTVFDPFAGGGSIPLEASRMGFEAHAGDLNPVAVLLNKCNLELAPRWAGRSPVNPTDHRSTNDWSGTSGLAADLRYYAETVLRKTRETIGDLYPNAASGTSSSKVVAWIWCRTVASPNPAARGRHVPLASSFILTSKGERSAWIEIVRREDAPDGWLATVRTGPMSPKTEAKAKLGTKAGKAQDFICSLTDSPISRSYVQAEGKAGRLKERLVAVVADGGRSKLYLSPTPEQEIAVKNDAADEARRTFLAGPLPTRAEITGGVCTAYGLSTWGHLYRTRQLVALLSLGDQIGQIDAAVVKDAERAGLPPTEAAAYARSIRTFLALALDRCADFNNSLCRWSASNQKVMNLFARQALPMVFDFAEANILGDAVGAWSTCSGYVAECVEVLSVGNEVSPGNRAAQNDAPAGTLAETPLLVSTDPPYYDNISYSTLSDFFYVWLRRTLGATDRDLFATVLTPKVPELIASPDRFGGSREAARDHFEAGFRKSFSALREHLDPRFPMTVYYAFKQEDEKVGDTDDNDSDESSKVDLTTGWETLLEALIGSGFFITATLPVRASQKWRMVSMGTNALASYIVLACRVRGEDAPTTTRGEFRRILRKELPGALRNLQQGNIAPVDVAQASIGPGMAIFSRHKEVLEANGKPMSVRSALQLINEVLDEYLASGEGDFDADTRFAITWYEQHGWDEGDFGDAETLAKARNVSVKGVEEAGICKSAAGKVRILKRHEMRPLDYDPAADERPTVWEFTQHMIRNLEDEGEEAAARLLKKLGSAADSTRELAYRLYNTCERKKWAEDARSYNALILAWTELEKLAARMGDEPPPAAPSKPAKNSANGKKKSAKTTKAPKKGQQALFEGDD